MTSEWVSLFSGGKDSSWALYRMLEEGLNATRLLTVHPSDDSYMYHVPATGLAALAAESTGIEFVEVHPGNLETIAAADSGARGDAELGPLEAALSGLQVEINLAGVTAGATESELQAGRIQAMCDRLDIDLFAPLWRENPRGLGDAMLEAGFEITVVQIAAHGLDESWLGRTLDVDTLDELAAFNDQYGVHILGEGGEFETLVIGGPHMDRSVELECETEWEGTHGRLHITDAFLGEESG